MKKPTFVITIAALSLLMGACTTELQKAQRTQAQGGNDLTRAQSQTYLAMAENQYQGQYDFSGSERFARKSMQAARGEPVAPDSPGDKGLRPVKLNNELVSARQRMVSALQITPAPAPALAARAQGAYDCWLDEAADPIYAVEGDWLNSKVQNCRRDFDAAMTELERRPTATSTPPAAAVPAARPAGAQQLLVFFDFDRSDLTPEAQSVIRTAANNVRQGGVARIQVVGHADRSGSDAYNMALSSRRANAVRAALIRAGVPQNQITTEARGETQPLVPTADGAREPQNRRAEIVAR